MVEFKIQCLKVFCYHGNKSTILLFNSIFRTVPEVFSKLYFVEICYVSEKLWLFNHKRADFWLPNFGFKRSLLSLLKEELKVESLVTWENFCNSVSLETNSNESWRKIKNFLKAKGQRDYPTLHHANKVAKTGADKAQLFVESVKRQFGIESDHFDLIRITFMRSTNS